MSEDADIDSIAALLDDECARCILVRTRTKAMPAPDLADHCDVSGPTVYRRLSDLEEQKLVVKRIRPDEDGHHASVYRANLDRVTVRLTGEGFDVRVDRTREAMADRFTRLIEDI